MNEQPKAPHDYAALLFGALFVLFAVFFITKPLFPKTTTTKGQPSAQRAVQEKKTMTITININVQILKPTTQGSTRPQKPTSKLLSAWKKRGTKLIKPQIKEGEIVSK